MHLAKSHELKPVKGLKRPAARLTDTVRPVLSQPFISLEKNGVSNAWSFDRLLIQKPDRKLLWSTKTSQAVSKILFS